MLIDTEDKARAVAISILTDAYNDTSTPAAAKIIGTDLNTARKLLRALEAVGLTTVRHDIWRTTCAGYIWSKYGAVNIPFDIESALDNDEFLDRWSRELVFAGAKILRQYSVDNPLKQYVNVL